MMQEMEPIILRIFGLFSTICLSLIALPFCFLHPFAAYGVFALTSIATSHCFLSGYEDQVDADFKELTGLSWNQDKVVA